MTYLVAVKRGNETCLIADTFMTFRGQSQPGALKTGFLFAGCAYGITGSAEGGRRFIADFKRKLEREYPAGAGLLNVADHGVRVRASVCLAM
jgi:hypothetical protein